MKWLLDTNTIIHALNGVLTVRRRLNEVEEQGRPWQRQGRQESGAAERGAVAGSDRSARIWPRGKVRPAEIPPPRLGVIV